MSVGVSLLDGAPTFETPSARGLRIIWSAVVLSASSGRGWHGGRRQVAGREGALETEREER